MRSLRATALTLLRTLRGMPRVYRQGFVLVRCWFFCVCWFLLSSLLLNGFLWGHSDKNNNHFSSQTQQRVVPVHHRSYGVIYLSLMQFGAAGQRHL